MMDPTKRFWSKVRRPTDEAGACWLWTARVDRGGYGMFSVSRQTLVRAHRHSFELTRGPVDATRCVLHRCGERRCVNPDHLYLGSAHDCLPRRRSRRVSTARRPSPAGRGERHWTHRTPDKVRRGARSNLSKLGPAEVQEIRALVRAGDGPVREVAAIYDVCWQTIRNIADNRTWRDLVAHGE